MRQRGKEGDALEVTPNDSESAGLERFSAWLIAFHQCLDLNYIRLRLQTNTAPAEMAEQFPPQATGMPIFQTG